MNITILILEYEPLFTDGRVVRMRFFSEYLRDKGAQVSIIHLSNTNYEKKENGITTYGLKYPGLSNVARVRKSNSSRAGNWLFEFVRKLSQLVFPDRYLFSVVRLSKKIRQICKAGDTLVVSMPRFSPLLIFCFDKLVPFNVNVIFDYRDLWVNNRIFVRNKIENWLAKKIEKKALSRAKGVMVTTNPAKGYFNKQGIEDVWLVRNGISLRDYDTIRSENQGRSLVKKPIEKELHDVAVGYFGNIGHRRNAEALFKVLKSLNVDLRVFGALDEKHRLICGESYKGSVDRTQALKEASQCDVLVVVIRAAEDSSYAMPGKLFEYMALNKPILLFCPPDALIAVWLSKYHYPHVLVNSELPDFGLSTLNQQLINLYRNSGSNTVEKEAVPIREHEYNKVYDAICSWQGIEL